MEKQIRVLETGMCDGIDIIHTFTSVEEALESGRFDYLIEQDEYTEEELSSYKSVEEFIEKIGYPFFLY